jgi:hypothetical protein
LIFDNGDLAAPDPKEIICRMGAAPTPVKRD